MKTVYSTKSQVAHAWATQSQPFGRSPTPGGGGGMWQSGQSSATESRVRFVGRIFYSYSTPVARLEPIHGREALVLLTVPNEWGPSTGSHITEAAFAVSHLIDAGEGVRGRWFEVPHIGRHTESVDYYQRSGGLDWQGNPPTPGAIDHVGNLAHLIAAYREAAATFLRKRGDIWCNYKTRPAGEYGVERYSESETVANDLRAKWAAVQDYAEWFGPLHVPADFPATFAAVEAEAAAIMAERAARKARALAKLTPKELERRAAAKAAREAAAEKVRALRFADAAEKLAGWREGLNVPTHSLPYSTSGAYIRAVGVKRNKAGQITAGTLETSQGARVPLVEAIRVFQFLVCVRERGQAWEPRGLGSVRVGQFAVSRIDASGDFVAGCHRFVWPEVSALAEGLGVAALPCDSSVEAA